MQHYLDESHILLFLTQLAIILFMARVLGEVFRKFKQPMLTAELLVGIVLGPTILGRFFPAIFSLIFPADVIQQNMLETTAWIGVLFLLLDTGLEINFSSAWKQKGNAMLIAFTDIIIPIVVAFIPSYFLADVYLVNVDKRIQFSLFMAVVMTISAMPIASRVLHDLKLLKTDMGFLTMSALAVNDIIGWGLFTIILGLFTQNIFNLGNVSLILLITVGFTVLALTVGRILSNKTIDFFRRKNFPEPSSSFTFACFIGIVFGAITQKIGIHALFGFFIAGVVVGEAKNLKEETRSIISQMVHALFVPLFFVNIGLKIDFIENFDVFLVVLITFVGIFGRFLGAWVGVTFSNVPKVNKALIAIAHTPGGMMEIVVALMALELNLITPKIFIAIVVSAVFSSILMGPWMSFAMRKRNKIKLTKYINFEQGMVSLDDANNITAIERLLEKASEFVKKLPKEQLQEEIMHREMDFSTAIGDGLAIPHIRTNMIKDPLLVFGYTKKGIDWNAPDGKAVHLFIFLLSPASVNDLHVEILSKIARVLQNKKIYAQLLESNSIDDTAILIKNMFQNYENQTA